MVTIFYLCSVFALFSLHLFMYGCNLYMWKATRINHNFIFEFSPSTALKHRDAFLICTVFMTAVVGAMVLHLLLRAAGFFPGNVDAIPGILLLVSLSMKFVLCRFMLQITISNFYHEADTYELLVVFSVFHSSAHLSVGYFLSPNSFLLHSRYS